ncbi:hypothetical protein CCACVL1_03887 [Corchorus capsularis]|uniref:non-specific serine/threonine protein kinase n=1 Tax=Corchorus capsularis TaxID=210143 RepID=A0A1R3JWQ0_COCAP|nr:hypothetical protein CCACVL1_03887 [Corchorus capsularis]
MATHDNFVQPSIPRFDGHHYDHWSMLMENFLRSKEYWTVVETGVPELAAAATDAQKVEADSLRLKDLKAKNYLFQAIDRVLLETILHNETSKQIWDSLKKKYQGNARARRQLLQSLRGEFETLQMKPDESVSDYFSRTMAVTNKLRIHGDSVADIKIIEKLMNCRTHCRFMSRRSEGKRTRNNCCRLKHRLYKSQLNQDHQIKARVTGKGKSSKDHEGDRKGSWEKQKGAGNKGKSKAHIECFRCHKRGHYKSECRTNLSKGGERSNYIEQEEKEAEISLLMVCHTKEESAKNMWYLDTGCSNHMSGDKKAFAELDETFTDTVKFGDDSTVEVKGKGNVRIQTNSGQVQSILNVLYVPDLKTNLLSIGQLQEKGYEIVIKNGVCQVKDAKLGLIVQAKMTSNRMFPVYLQNSIFNCLAVEQGDLAWLWHYRFGHLYFGGLQQLQRHDMVRGLPKFEQPSDVCEECVLSKQHRDAFPKGKAWRAQYVLELVHTDLCGPITPTSNGGKNYFITFIDDYSRKTWVYFLQFKSEAFEMFKKFKQLVEKESGKYIKMLRSDRGGEFTSDEFVTFCENAGIKRQMTAPHTPQQNGVCERKNRTILDMVRSILRRSSMPRTFWPEAVAWSTHVLNRSPSRALNSTPEEAWSGVRPAVHYFRVFGCIAYAHVPDQKRKKLDDKGEKCVLLGVSEESKAYKLYNPTTKKLIISRDVVFNENEFWPWDSPREMSKTASILDDEVDEVVVQPVVPQQQMQQEIGVSTRPQRIKRRSTLLEGFEVTGLPNFDSDHVSQLALFADCDPVLFEEAVKEAKWQKAMAEEIKAIEKNNTWELVDLPEGEKAIGVKWVYKTKVKPNGEVDKYKARLVVKGYKQEYGVDYTEVFAPVARLDTVRMVIALAAQNSWSIYQLDVKSAFLHGELKEQVFVEQPSGFIKYGDEHKVYRLRKALYGLKQAPRAWYSRIDSYFVKEGFLKCPYEHTLYVKHDGDKMMIICLFGDASSLSWFGDYSIRGRHFCLPKKYVNEVLDRFQMGDCNCATTPMEQSLKLVKNPGGEYVNSSLFKQMVGSLMYLTASRPDIMHSVGIISRFMEKPMQQHLLAAKRILRYLKGTPDFGKSTTGYVFKLGSAAIAWSSKKQPIVTLSSTEAEYVAATSGACQAVWMRRTLAEMKMEMRGATRMFCDNSSAIKLSKNPVFHGRTKHIHVRFHFLRELVEKGEIELSYCRTEDQAVDIFTKPLKAASFFKLLMASSSVVEDRVELTRAFLSELYPGKMSFVNNISIIFSSGEEIRVTFSEHHMNKLVLDQLIGQQTKPVLVVAATIVQDYLGNKFLATSSASTLFVNPSIKEAEEIRTRFAHDRTPVLVLGDGSVGGGGANEPQQISIDRLLYLTTPYVQLVPKGVVDPILDFNKGVAGKDWLEAYTRINVPFPCDCINGDFLGPVFEYELKPGDTYDKIASSHFANLTTPEWLERFNIYAGSSLPEGSKLNVTVNCSCGDASVSKHYGLFITYPLRYGETLDTVLIQTNLSKDVGELVQSYNEGVNFSRGDGLVFVPGKGAVAGLLLLASGVLYFGFKRKRLSTFKVQPAQSRHAHRRKGNGPKATFIDTSIEFSYEELDQATNSFSMSHKIGEGGFGAVYYAELRGEKVAIKKMDMQASKEFIAELRALTHIHHLNLVHLIGYCVEGSLFLVYEFIENGNLSQHLLGAGNRDPLPWSTRLQIALDSARGLEYIHEHTVPRYIHRDIKSANILIDRNFHGKVADFGLAKAKLSSKAGSAALIPSRLVGTFGYLAPEYAQRGEASPKVDVYAFGVVLCELISAKPAIVKTNDSEIAARALLNLFGNVLNQPDPREDLCKLIDPRLGDNYPYDSVYKMALLAKACTQENPKLRPNMRSIVIALTTILSPTDNGNVERDPLFYENLARLNIIITTRPESEPFKSGLSCSTFGSIGSISINR